MSDLLRALSRTFSAGCLGGLINSLAVWGSGALNITLIAGVKIAPALTAGWLYPRIVWGGLWGFLFLIPFPGVRWWVRGLIYSLGPSAVQLLAVFPLKTPAGTFGLGLGTMTPVFVLVFNAIWGIAAAWLLRRTE